MNGIKRNAIFIGILLLTPLLAFADSTRTFEDSKAKSLYQALVQANFSTAEKGGIVTVKAKDIACSIQDKSVFTDHIERGKCARVSGIAAALAISHALLDAGVTPDAGMSQTRVKAKAIFCVAKALKEDPWATYSCKITADFSS